MPCRCKYPGLEPRTHINPDMVTHICNPCNPTYKWEVEKENVEREKGEGKKNREEMERGGERMAKGGRGRKVPHAPLAGR